MDIRPWLDKNGKQVMKDGQPSWHLRHNVKNPETGRRSRPSTTVYGPKKFAVQEWIRIEAENRETGGHVKPSNITVADCMNELLDFSDTHKKPTTAESYREMSRLHIIPHLGGVPLAELTTPMVDAWISKLAKTKSGRTPKKGSEEPAPCLSPRTVNYARSILRRALNRTISKRHLAMVNPVHGSDAMREDPKKPKAFTLEQGIAIDAAAERTRLQALLRVWWRMGFRIGEWLSVTWDQVDFKDRAITIETDLSDIGGELVVQTSPKSRFHTAAMNNTVVAELQAHRERQAEERERAGAAWQDNNLVFCTQTGGKLIPRNVARTHYAVLKAAGVPRQGTHSHRHTFATLTKREGAPIEDIADALGHADPSFTARTYAHVTKRSRRAVVDLLEAATTQAAAAAKD